MANEFAIHIAKDHDDLLDEMKGIAEGAGQEWIDIVALNVRSEVSAAVFRVLAGKESSFSVLLAVRSDSLVRWPKR